MVPNLGGVPFDVLNLDGVWFRLAKIKGVAVFCAFLTPLLTTSNADVTTGRITVLEEHGSFQLGNKLCITESHRLTDTFCYFNFCFLF